MSLLHKEFDQINVEDLELLILNGVAESRVIEYKEKLPGDSGDERKEFLADITSMANSAGGDIIFGISEFRPNKESTGRPGELVGVEVDNEDALMRKYESLVRDGVQPRIYGVRMRLIRISGSRYIFIIRLPRSLSGPHMVIYSKTYRFYIRNSASKHMMEAAELRSAFLSTSNALEKVQRFREIRLARIMANEGYKELMPPEYYDQLPPFHFIVVQVIPIGSTEETFLDIQTMRDHKVYLKNLGDTDGSGSNRNEVNFEGFITHTNYSHTRPSSSYVQILRNGSIEAVDTDLLFAEKDKKVIRIQYIERILVERIFDYLNAIKLIGLLSPIALGVSFLNVKDFDFALPNRIFGITHKKIGRDNLIIPEILLESFPEDLQQTAVMVRPILDALYNAAGKDSAHFDQSGRWVCPED